MFRRASVHYGGFLLVFAALTGCAGVQGRGGLEVSPSRTEVKLTEANKALDAANEKMSAFYAQLNSVIDDINGLRSRPCWNEFELILLEYPFLKDPDTEAEITPEIKARLSEWARKWKTSWEQTLEEYMRVADRCVILDARRLAARERLYAAQAGYVAVVIMESSSGHEKRAKEVYSIVEALDKSGAELDSYQPDDLGLYSTGRDR